VNRAPPFQRVALIGLGLIGSSIARGVKQLGLAKELVATDASPDVRARAAEIGLADRIAADNAEAVHGADLVIACVPVGVCGDVAKSIAADLLPGAIVSDTGSVKGTVLREMAEHLPGNVHFIPAHPVAGTENSGPDSGFGELFINRWCILTPPANADAAAMERLTGFWRALGANVEVMNAEHHDLVLAVTSHLPHLIAYTIVGTADELDPIRPCGATCFSPTRTPCWKCSASFRKTSPNSPGRSAAATARRCSSISPAPERSAAASSRSARTKPAPTSGDRMPI
jgi:cyclohexadieny/prephenate dehydrogenase